MNLTTLVLLTVLFFTIATLYSSVGHAGASGYLAVMALFSMTPDVMRPTALILNILVAAVATVQFYRAGAFTWRLFWPFALTSIPCAFIGGAITLPASIYRPIVGVTLLWAAYRMVMIRQTAGGDATSPVPLWLALLLGALIGLLSGLTGVGGGIFLSPLLIFALWADPRQAAGVAAPFILVNSLAGLVGGLANAASLPPAVPVWGVVALVGGGIGAQFGSRRFNSLTLRRLLGVVLVIGGIKLMLT